MFKTADRKRESTQERTAMTIVLANVAYTEQNKTRLLGCLSQNCYHLRTQPNHKSLHIHSFNTPQQSIMFYVEQESLNLQLSLFGLEKVLIVRALKQRSEILQDILRSLAFDNLQELD